MKKDVQISEQRTIERPIHILQEKILSDVNNHHTRHPKISKMSSPSILANLNTHDS
jgi:hypothetical protein